MGWSKTPLVAIGDVIQASQIDEVRSAIIERRDALGLSFSVPDKSPGNVCFASTVNVYRQRIETLIPEYGRFTDGSTWEDWTKAQVFEAALGAGRNNWMNTPARDPQEVSYGNNLAGGTIMYVEHLSEMQAVLNQLRWIKKELQSYADVNGVGGLHKLPEASAYESKTECIAAFEDDIAAASPLVEGISNYGGIWLRTYQEGEAPDITYNLYTVPFDLNRGFMEVDTPDVGGFNQVKVSGGCTSQLNAADPWPSWQALIYYATTDPDPLDADDWNFGTLLASAQVSQSGSIMMEGVTTPPGDTAIYLQMRGKETDFSSLESENWLEQIARQAHWGGDHVYMYFECNFQYQ